MYNPTLPDKGAVCSSAHRRLTTKPSFSRTPPSTGKHTWETLPYVLKCMYLFRLYKWILEQMAFTGNYQNKRMAKNRSFSNEFQLWPENSNQLGLWIVCPTSGENPQYSMWNQVLAYNQRLLPSAQPTTLHCPSVPLIWLPRDVMPRTQSLPKHLFFLLSFGCGSKLHLQSIPSLSSIYQSPPLPWKPSLKLTPNQNSSQFPPSWIHFFLPRSQ